jgi:hypothetical protein
MQEALERVKDKFDVSATDGTDYTEYGEFA